EAASGQEGGSESRLSRPRVLCCKFIPYRPEAHQLSLQAVDLRLRQPAPLCPLNALLAPRRREAQADRERGLLGCIEHALLPRLLRATGIRDACRLLRRGDVFVS